MQKLVKIAFANVIRNGKRSLLIGTAIFVSCALLLISGAFGNGAAAAIMNEYYSQQAGDVVLLWENALKLEKDSPSRIYLSQFDPQKAGENKKALARFAEFLRRHESEIRKAFPVVRRSATVVTADDMIDVNVYGLGSDEWRFLEPRKTIILEEGAFEATPDSSVIVSRLIADAAHLRVGDWMTLEVTTAYGVRNSLDYRIAGIYKNGVPWDNDYVYMSATDARLLYDFDPEDFDSTRIYLNDAHAGAAFAHELNAALGPARGVLQALEGQEASSFFTRQAGFFKNIFTIFVIFLTTIIGFGIRATVRMKCP